MTYETIKFGSFEMTTDAFVFLLSGIILYLVLISSYGFTFDYNILLVGYIIGAFRINCMIVGACNLFARYTAITSFILTGIIIMNLSSFQKFSKKIFMLN